MESDYLELESRHFTKMMGEGSDDDMDELLEKMNNNQNVNDSGIVEGSIKFESNLSENMKQLIRTIEERIDRERLGPKEKEQNEMLSDQQIENSISCDIGGDPSVISEYNTNKLINDIEQGLTYLYEKGEKMVIAEENIPSQISVKDRLGVKIEEGLTEIFTCKECGKTFPKIKQLQQHLNAHAQRNKETLKINEERRPSSQTRDESPSYFFDIQISQNSLESNSSTKSSTGCPIKKRLGEKVEEIFEETLKCIKCKKNFHTVTQLQHHITDHLKELKKMQKNIKQKLSRKSRNISPTIDGIDDDSRFIRESDKKVICRHCKMRFFKLDDLLCHLRAKHRHRKRNSSPRATITKKVGLHDKKNFAKSVEIKSRHNEIHRDSSITDNLQFICDLCRETFYTKYDLNEHNDRKHCRKTTSVSKVHDSLHIKFFCKICHVSFSKFCDLKIHLSLAHKRR